MIHGPRHKCINDSLLFNQRYLVQTSNVFAKDDNRKEESFKSRYGRPDPFVPSSSFVCSLIPCQVLNMMRRSMEQFCVRILENKNTMRAG